MPAFLKRLRKHLSLGRTSRRSSSSSLPCDSDVPSLEAVFVPETSPVGVLDLQSIAGPSSEHSARKTIRTKAQETQHFSNDKRNNGVVVRGKSDPEIFFNDRDGVAFDSLHVEDWIANDDSTAAPLMIIADASEDVDAISANFQSEMLLATSSACGIIAGEQYCEMGSLSSHCNLSSTSVALHTPHQPVAPPRSMSYAQSFNGNDDAANSSKIDPSTASPPNMDALKKVNESKSPSASFNACFAGVSATKEQPKQEEGVGIQYRKEAHSMTPYFGYKVSIDRGGLSLESLQYQQQETTDMVIHSSRSIEQLDIDFGKIEHCTSADVPTNTNHPANEINVIGKQVRIARGVNKGKTGTIQGWFDKRTYTVQLFEEPESVNVRVTSVVAVEEAPPILDPPPHDVTICDSTYIPKEGKSPHQDQGTVEVFPTEKRARPVHIIAGHHKGKFGTFVSVKNKNTCFVRIDEDCQVAVRLTSIQHIEESSSLSNESTLPSETTDSAAKMENFASPVSTNIACTSTRSNLSNDFTFWRRSNPSRISGDDLPTIKVPPAAAKSSKGSWVPPRRKQVSYESHFGAIDQWINKEVDVVKGAHKSKSGRVISKSRGLYSVAVEGAGKVVRVRMSSLRLATTGLEAESEAPKHNPVNKRPTLSTFFKSNNLMETPRRFKIRDSFRIQGF